MSRATRLFPVLLLVAIFGVGLALATVVIPTRGPLRWDEATHALKALVIAHDLATGDWPAFLFNSYRQVLYPPLHSWLLALVYLVAGPSIAAVAGLSLALYLAAALLLYQAGATLSHSRANIVGAVAALLWLTAPPLLEYATQGMLEMPGLAALVLALLVAIRLLHADRRDQGGTGAPMPRRWLWLGLALAITYFVRTPFGIVLGLALAVTILARAQLRPRRLWRPEIGWFLLPLIILFGVWFAYPAKIPATLQWLVNYPDGVDDPYSVEGWLFYPLALMRISGGPWLLAFFVGGLLWAWWKRSSAALTLLTALLLIQFGLGMFHQNKQARYLFPMLPALFLVGGMAVNGLWQWARQRTGYAWAAASLATLLLLAQCALLLTGAIRPGPGDRPDPITAAVLAHLEDAPATLILGSMDMGYPSAPLLDWKLIVAGKLAAPQAGAAAQIEEARRLAQLTDRLPLPNAIRQRLVTTVTAYDAPAPVRTLYAGLPLRASYGQLGNGYDRFVTELIQAQAIEQVLLVSMADGRRFPIERMVAPLEAAGFRQQQDSTVSAGGMTVWVFTRE